MLLKDELLLAKIESTYNTDPTPGASDAVVFHDDISWQNEGLRMVERPVVKSGLDMEQRLYAGMLQTFTVRCELKGSGAAGTAPEIGPMLRACGMGETISASTSVTYAPVSSSIESVTLYYFEDGVRQIVTGCRGTCVFNFEAGTVPSITFTLTGHPLTPTDTAQPTPTYDSTVPVPLVSIPFTWGGTSLIISSFGLDCGIVIATEDSMSAADGFADVQIVSRDPGGTLNPESVLVATEAFIANLRADATNAISIGSIGATAGNIIDLDIPVAYLRDVSPSERGAIRTKELQYGAAVSSGDDEWSLVFT